MLIPVLVLSFDAIAPIKQAHANLHECAVRIVVTAAALDQYTEFSYDLYRDTLGRFRIDFRTATGSEFIFFADKTHSFIYDSKRNIFVERQVRRTDTPTETVAAAFGATEPMMQVFLEPKTGLEGFLAIFGAKELTAVEGKQNEFKDTKSPSPVTLIAHPESHLIQTIMVGEIGHAAKWTITNAPLSIAQAIPWTPPHDAKSMESLAEDALPTAAIAHDAKPIVERSRAAYRQLRFLSFTSTTYFFADNQEERRFASAYWQRGGKVRLAVTAEPSNRSLESFFDGTTFSAYDRANKTAYRGNATLGKVIDLIDALGGLLEPLVTALITKQDYWTRFLQPGSEITLRSDKNNASELQIKTIDGWTINLTIRPHGLIDRIDRTLAINGKVVSSETVIYNFTRINEAIPERAWTLPVPDGTKFNPLPKID